MTKLRLKVNRTPDGATTHQIAGGTTQGARAPLATLSGTQRMVADLDRIRSLSRSILLIRGGGRFRFAYELIDCSETDIFLKPGKQMAVEAYLLDDRGKEHVCDVWF